MPTRRSRSSSRNCWPAASRAAPAWRAPAWRAPAEPPRSTSRRRSGRRCACWAGRERETGMTGSDTDRFVSPLADAGERQIEGALRPRQLAEFVGPLRISSGPAIERAGDLASVLTSLAGGEVVFIDEIHRLARPAEEMLYLAMEEFRFDVMLGKGPRATALPLDVAPFTLVGATTRAGLLPAPLRDRFGFTGHLDFYDPAELGVIIRRSAGLLGVTLRDEGADEIASRSRGTPRIANRLLRRVRDFAEVRGDGVVSKAAARTALELYEVDESGLDRLDRAVLTALVRRFGGGPVGLSTLAVVVGEEAETVEVVAEPFLVRAGLMARTPRGRVATPAAWSHLGLAAPPAGQAPGGPGDGAAAITLFD